MHTSFLNLLSLSGALIFLLKQTHFIIVMITIINNSLLFREPPSSVFQLYFHSLKILESTAAYAVIILSF